jgi:hypothetical protein
MIGWLIIGVPHLAVVHYEKVLSMVQKRMDAEEHEDVKEVRDCYKYS